MPANNTIILLTNLGGPSSMGEVEQFLLSLLGDKYVIRLPWYLRWFQPFLARNIVKKRLPKSKKLYSEIGGKSPIQAISQMQAYFLSQKLGGMPVYPVMRHGKQNLDELIEHLNTEIASAKHIIVIPLYPQYSTTTTLSSDTEISQKIKELYPSMQLTYVRSYPTHPLYIQSWVQMIRYQLTKLYKEYPEYQNQRIEIIYSAHSIPEQYVTKYNDPYQEEITKSYQAIAEHLPEYDHTLTYQSRFGKGKWLEPMTDDYLKTLPAGHIVMVVPISFVSEHVETIHEIGIQFREIAEERGIQIHQIPTPSCLPSYIACLHDLAIKAMV